MDDRETLAEKREVLSSEKTGTKRALLSQNFGGSMFAPNSQLLMILVAFWRIEGELRNQMHRCINKK